MATDRPPAASCDDPPSDQASLSLPAGSRPLLTVSALWQGPPDPTMRVGETTFVRATRTPAGPASVRVGFAAAAADGTERRVDVRAEAWGAGAATAVAHLLPAWLGLSDDPAQLRPRHALVAALARRFAGVRLARGGSVWEALLVTIIGQKVTSFEARRSYRLLVQRWGEPAPGGLGLRLAPAAETLARLPYHAFHAFGLERRRADALRSAAAAAQRLQTLAESEPGRLRPAIESLPGLGPWTSAEVARLAAGDPDALSVGDYNLPSLVSWALAGERRADDGRMLQLLEPYRGQRARVVQLLELGGHYPPRHGPRRAARSIAGI